MALNDRESTFGPDELRGDDVGQFQSPMTVGKKAVRPLYDSNGNALVTVTNPGGVATIVSSVPSVVAITLGGTSELVDAANVNRGDLFITNISDTVMYASRSSTAITESGFPIQPNGTLKIGSEYKGDVSIVCATTGKKYALAEGSIV